MGNEEIALKNFFQAMNVLRDEGILINKNAVRIGRTKFDQLVQANMVKTIKKDRKIYVPMGEVERYFKPL